MSDWELALNGVAQEFCADSFFYNRLPVLFVEFVVLLTMLLMRDRGARGTLMRGSRPRASRCIQLKTKFPNSHAASLCNQSSASRSTPTAANASIAHFGYRSFSP